MHAMRWAVILALFPLSVTAQEFLQPETLFEFKRIGEHAVSPDGKTLIFTATQYSIEENKGNADLYSIPVTGGTAVPLTSSSYSESNPRWRPDGLKIAYIDASEGEAQVYEMNPDGSGKSKITQIPGGVSNFNYSPDGKRIYFTQDVKTLQTLADLYPDLPKANARIIDGLMYRHWNYWEDEFSSHVFYADYTGGVISAATDIMAGEPYDAPLMPFGGEEQLNWAPDGSAIAYTCKKLTGTEYATSTNSDIYLYNISTKKTKNLSEGNMGYDTEPRFSPDGKWIAWLQMKTPGFEADQNRIILYEIATGKTTDLMTSKPSMSAESAGFNQSAGNLVWSADGKSIYFSSATQGTNQLYVVDVASGKFRKITSGKHDLMSFELGDANGEVCLVTTRTTHSNPLEMYRVNLSDGGLTAVTTVNDAIVSRIKWGNEEERWITTTDGKKMQAWVVYPPDFDATKKYPTLLYCQGGPQSMVSQFFSYRWNLQLMAAQGYIVIAPNRRGLPGFGQQWNDQISGDWGGQCMDDMLRAIDDISKEVYVDTNRRAAVGASFGGYTVYWLAGNHNKRFKSFIAHCGVFNLTSMYGQTEEIFFSNHDFGGPYWDTALANEYQQFSPHTFVQNWDTPILVIHNEKDFRVPLSEGMQAFTAAQLQGIKSRFLYFGDEGHWVSKPQNSILWQRVYFDWLKETLK